MKTAVPYIIPALLAVVICYGGVCWAIGITATGSWSQTIDASNLTGGAGTDLNSTYQSASNAVVIDIIGAGSTWGVAVKKITSNWHSSLHLSVKRTSDGTGVGTISGGTSYQEVTDIDQSFFSGNRSRANVNVQFQLTGVSIQVPPGVYTATVYYTVTGT